MITISLFRNESHKITGFTVSGHAGFGDAGTDIVCAAVTTAVMTTVNGLTDVAKIELAPTVREGYVACALPKQLTEKERHDADLLLDSLVLTLENLTEQYAAFVTLKEESAV
ncbi:MAG: ribosomal-processing cysteine protease Prp [Clostridia bacterium]|nr:ribosomal-processing cysteine protease Prp [Clostridia bacterium]